MRIWVVIEHLSRIPKDGFEHTACALFLSKEKAQKTAEAYNKWYAPDYFTIEPVEVYE